MMTSQNKTLHVSQTSYWEDLMKRTLMLGAALGLAFGAGLATQSIVGAQTAAPPAPSAKTLMDEALIGGTYEQMLMQEVTFQPGSGAAWHIHPDGHEIAYVLEGAIKVWVDKNPERVVKAGEGLHMNANVPHRATAEPSGAKLLIVRLKPKDKPVAQPVPAPTN
jgi:quercetin dioxygenase-like cupin family protein